MKKKVFSKLLMVALVATVGAFTSCKDYDDDINDLRSRIDGLNTSLNTTVANKITAVESSVDLLSKQLSEVKADYAKADEALKTALEATDSKAMANASDILKLQQEVVTLKSADANLQAAIDKLEAALKDANATLKTQGETLIGLAKADEALEKGIKEAKAQADNALTEAKKAQETAATNAANLKSTDATLAALQNTVAENLKTVNSKIDSEIAKLDTRIKTNETNIAALQTASAKAEANIVTINAKLEELAKKDNEISTKLDTELGKLAESLNTNVADLKTMINNAKSDLTEKIGEEATIRAKAISDLSDHVTANETAIAFIQEETIPQLIKNLREHLVPEYVTAEVAKQLPAALEVFMNDEVMPYVEDIVATETGKNKTLIDALTDKVKQDSIDLAAYTDAQFLLTAGLLAIHYDLDAEDLGDVPASALANAIAAGDSILQDNIEAVADALADEKDADKAGSLAALIAQIKNEADATSIAGKLKKLTNDFNDATNEAKAGSLANRFKTIEDFFAPAADDAEASDISVANLAAKIAETKSFTDAVNKAAADANGEILDMITAIHLFANQHMAHNDKYGEVKYTDGQNVKWHFGYDNFDDELNFVYTIEQGKYNAQLTELVSENIYFPHDYVANQDITNAYNYSPSHAITGGKEDVDYFEFKDGRYRSYEDSILVRVSPVNADLRKAKIALLNSKGVDIVEDSLVEIVSVSKYDRMLTRAASGNETGLWVIKFKLNDGKVYDKYLENVYYEGNKILYAVAVKNTGISIDEEGNQKSEGKERYVASEYDLTLETTLAKHAWDFDVNNVSIEKIHNRYIETEEGVAGNSAYWTDDKERSSFSYELLWKTPCQPEVEESEDDDDDSELTPTRWWYEFCCECNWTPTGDYVDECYENGEWVGKNNEGYTYVYFDKTRDGYEENKPDPYCYADINAIDRVGHSFTDTGARQTTGRDNRHLKPFLPIEFTETLPGEDGKWAKIEIEFPYANVCGELTPIKGFFVTLDQQFAKESQNSEINAWWHYEYKNVALFSWGYSKAIVDSITLQKGNKGVIYVKDDNNLNNGDVIGFRVHAVNYDGTLYDPDGRAFYVQIGKETTKKELSFDVTVTTSDPNKDSAWAVQNLVDGENPIVAYNNAMKEDGIDKRFFNRNQYKGSFIPEETYQIVYTWREDNPAIKALNSEWACIPVAGTGFDGTKAKDAKNHANAVVINTGNNIKEVNRPTFDVEEFFDFRFSENANADIEDETDGVKNEWTAYNKDYGKGPKTAANRLTQSVKATIRPAAVLRLIDGETYKITATIYRNDAQTSWVPVDVIDIDITKKMPEDQLPEAFAVKSLQLQNAVTFYMRPLVANDVTYAAATTGGTPTTAAQAQAAWPVTWGMTEPLESKYGTTAFANELAKGLTWNAADDKWKDYTAAGDAWHNYRWAVDVRQYDFEEIFKGILIDEKQADGTVKAVIDPDYYFEFPESGSYKDAYISADGYETQIEADDAESKTTATAVYDPNFDSTNGIDPAAATHKGGYHLPFIHYSNVAEKGKGAEHIVKVGYIYRQISSVLKDDTKFYKPTVKNDRFAASSGLANGDYKLKSVADLPVSGSAGTKQFKAKYECAFDNAVALKDSVWKKTNDIPAVRYVFNIEYETAAINQLDVTDKNKNIDEIKLGAAKNVISTDYCAYSIDDQWLSDKGDKTHYFNAGLDEIGNETVKSLTWLLSKRYLVIENLDSVTIQVTDCKNAGNTLLPSDTGKDNVDNKTLAPKGAAVAYNAADYFTWFYAKADGSKAKKSEEVAGIAFKIAHRTGVRPNLPNNVYATVTFPVWNVWNHKRENVKLYVRFQLPKSGASRQMR